MNDCRGVIFDFNGTLFFDTPFHEQAWQTYAAQLCGRTLTDEEFRDHIHGRTNAEILAYCVGDSMSEDDIRRHGEAKEALYREICLSQSEAFRLAAGAEEYFNALRERGVLMAIATSSGLSNVNFYRERFGLDRWFNRQTLVYNDGSMRSKPFPDIYLRAAAAIGLAPEECTVYEDMPSGIAAAKAAGAGRIIAIASALAPTYLQSLEGVAEVIADFTGQSSIA